MNIKEVDRNKLSPMMVQYIEIKEANLDKIIFFRVGDFYEMFFEDALNVAPLLELTLTGKQAGLEDRIPMCGVPHHAYLTYAKKLVDLGFKVAICEQLENPALVKGIVKRDIIQVLSKGTVINEETLVATENNYIGYLTDIKYAYLISFLDLSTGECFATKVNHNKLRVVSEIKSLGIVEMVVTNKIDPEIIDILRNNYRILVTIIEPNIISELDANLFVNINQMQELSNIHKSFNILTTYLISVQKQNIDHLQPIVLLEEEQYLNMDIQTKKNLELTENIRSKDKEYTLLWLLNKTKTSSGARLLKRFIEHPIVDICELNNRYDIVDKLLLDFLTCEQLRESLKEVYDIERLSGRIAFNTANGRDLVQLKNTLTVLPNIKEVLEKLNINKEFDLFIELKTLLELSINDDAPIGLKDGYLIKKGYDSALDELRDIRSNSRGFLLNLETSLKEKTGIKNLKIAYNKVFGYYIEVSRGSLDKVNDSYGFVRKQTLANCERFITPELKEYEDKILSAEDKIINLEYNLFVDVRNKCKEYINSLQKCAQTISYLDVMQSFAYVSEQSRYVRPVLTTSQEREVKIIDSRHPVVEKVLKKEIVSNDILIDDKTNILLITGPNMAGKSTFMRQTAIIVIMAQIGCFVPAKEAVMPIFDKIFTRIGASDDLVSGESTFMVEMMEANNALQNATKHSLILFDELGRGTATYDGMAIAQAILEYLDSQVLAKTIFSTHYHELTSLEKTLTSLKNIHVSALEEEGKITFLYKVRPGSVDKSYGIHVASLAALPSSLINRASSILEVLEQKNNQVRPKEQLSLPLYIKETNETEEYLKKLDVLSLTPIEAINILNDLVEKQKKGDK